MDASLVVQAGGEIPPLTTEILVIFAIIALALVLFITEPVPIDIVAIAVLVALVVLEPWTQIDPATGVGGFASSATVTVLAMFVLSEGIRRSGLINIIGTQIAERYGSNPFKQLLAVLGLSGGTAGFINNTPVVAVMIPMVNTLSRKTGISPSKLLIPVSYTAMLGGMLTLIGTSTNILASDVSARLIGRPFSMFEFTQLGLLVLVTGIIYLMTVGRLLIPERIKMSDELIEGFEMTEYLTEVVVTEDSRLIGKTVPDGLAELKVEADIVQLVRNKQVFSEPLARKEIRAGDVLVLRTDQESLLTFIESEGLELAPDAEVDEDQLRVEDDELEPVTDQRLVEVVISPEASVLGQTLETLNFRQRYDATVLAIRRGGEIIHARMDERRLRAGDTLLIQATETTVKRFANDRDFIVAQELTLPDFRYSKMPLAIGIVVAVVALAALEIVPILISALGGIVAMVATGCVKPEEVYPSVDWSVIVLLAGLIPLGVAMERTGAAEWLASVIVVYGVSLSPVVLLGAFYLFTALITNVVSNNASVVLMIPVAIDTANAIGADPFSFVLAVTFAASTAMMTPIGYQTNLMVYGPGGYKFTDFFRVGAPLQLLLTVVTTLGIVAFWGV
ncbi:SLC13 family permease [Halorubrum vacuolatum]|uniref:Di- and tricarboxylate transporter n=1 Tax=Halorubrum vacuolatum TaxID=63740 RepID=A0A238UUY8_HALVU|nr:SLC13 family permease [Halorubrum vacuolatum]SNR25039.1 Di- and tricarboxylate transporter [Halorubrum vacuolatum]